MTPEDRAGLVAASPLFSPRWWSHATGRSFGSVAEAAADYVARTSGGRRGLAPHPLFSRRWLATHGAPTPAGEDPLSWWLRAGASVACHPLLPPGEPSRAVADEVVAAALSPLAPVDAAGRILLTADGDSVGVLEQVLLLRDLPLLVALADASPEIRGALLACAALSPSIEVVETGEGLSPALLVDPRVSTLDPETAQALLDDAPAAPLVLDDDGLVAAPSPHAGLHPRDLREQAAYPTPDAPVRSTGPGALLVRPDLTVHLPGAARATSTAVPPAADAPRWTIDTAVVWANRERWGDWHFAQSLAAALERLGQRVAVEGREARSRDARRGSDVVLAIRGLDPVAPTPGAVNLLWVISHPDLVTREEAAGFDRVYAASAPWAAARSAEWGLAIEPLLQCTDASRFSPGELSGGPDVLFVGNARSAERPILAWARSAGVEVAVHGAGWRDRLPAGWWRSLGIPNTELSAAYGSAGVVLNDHHEDMRVEGFVSNRLFDAIASGALVVSDPVAGLAELFGDHVRTADAPATLRDGVLTPGWPSPSARLELAEHVRREHSFDARARTLLAESARMHT